MSMSLGRNEAIVIGSYIEHDPSDPMWPDGCSTHEYVRAYIPEVITLTYGKIMVGLLEGGAIEMEPAAFEKLQSIFESDARLANFHLELMETDTQTILVTVEKNKVPSAA